ncbi:hypothetical protein PARHAE_03807 [Paracoccus haematequi]|uniref:Uncharacterized protein n=1 Tax=Paracoccus haematequi TaxID=2491866 RepID=A0A447ISW1_9RHOB|nr:hypothetical protein [Paracoccus haematequi]VDS10591.1 hypothetical protein PARHAE_03807 [Paracoccus haematequi]
MVRPFVTAAVAIAPFPSAFDNTPGPSSVYSVRLSDGLMLQTNGAQMIFTDALQKAEPAMAALATAIENVIPKLQSNAETYAAAVIPAKQRDEIERSVVPLYRRALYAGVERIEKNAKSTAKFETPPPVKDAVLDQAVRDEFRPLTKAEKLKALRDWPIESIYAVHRVGREAFGLSADEYEAALNRIRAANLTASDNLKTAFVKRPTLNDPIAFGSDENAIEDYVQAALVTWANQREMIDDMRTELKQVVQFTSVVCEMPLKDAWTLLSGETDA